MNAVAALTLALLARAALGFADLAALAHGGVFDLPMPELVDLAPPSPLWPALFALLALGGAAGPDPAPASSILAIAACVAYIASGISDLGMLLRGASPDPASGRSSSRTSSCQPGSWRAWSRRAHGSGRRPGASGRPLGGTDAEAAVMNGRGVPDVRQATDVDAAAIAALLHDQGLSAGPSDILERLEAFRDTRSAVMVAVAAGEVVGFIAVHMMPRFDVATRIAQVLALVVEEEYGGEGSDARSSC